MTSVRFTFNFQTRLILTDNGLQSIPATKQGSKELLRLLCNIELNKCREGRMGKVIQMN